MTRRHLSSASRGTKKFAMRFVLYFALVVTLGVMCDPGRKFLVTLPQMRADIDMEKTPSCYLYVVPVKSDVTVTGSIATLPSAPFVVAHHFTIDPGDDYSFRIDEIAGVLPARSLVSNMTMEVQTDHDVVLVVRNSFSSNGDIFTAIPVDRLGTEYYALAGVSRKATAASFLAVSASEDDTEVNVTLPRGVAAGGPLSSAGGAGDGGEAVDVFSGGAGDGAGIFVFDLQDVKFTVADVITVKLNRLQTLQLQTSEDLTGAKVVSSKPVSVLSGQNRTNLLGLGCHSHILEQMPPVSHWARKFILIHLPNQTEGEHYRFVAKEPMTTVNIGAGALYDKRKIQLPGGFAEYDLSDGDFVYVKADKPILVGHYTREQTKENADPKSHGDPSLLALSPLEQARDTYHFSLSVSTDRHAFVVFTVLWEQRDALLLNGKNFSDNVTWSAVTGYEDYVVGHVTIGMEDLPCTLGEPGGPRFNAHVFYSSKCECQAMSLTHGRLREQINYSCPTPSHRAGDGIDNDCDGKIDEEPCCVDMATDADGDLYKSEDCASADALRCCSPDETAYNCRKSKKSSLFTEIRHFRRRSLKILPVQTGTKITCAVACARTAGCWGTNFNRKSLEGHTCELLIGRAYGLVHAPGWGFLSMASDTTYKAILPVP